MAYLKQHEQGMHGEGFLALWGLAYMWPKQKCLMNRTVKTVETDIYLKKLKEQEQIKNMLKKTKNSEKVR